MANKHMVTIDNYTKLVFTDALDAIDCYKLLQKALKLNTRFEQNPETGETDWDNPIKELVPVPIELSTLRHSTL